LRIGPLIQLDLSRKELKFLACDAEHLGREVQALRANALKLLSQ
jgi:hypothetical protein